MRRSTRALAFAIPVALATPAFGEQRIALGGTVNPIVTAKHETFVRPLTPQSFPVAGLLQIRGRNRLFGSWMPTEDVVLGLGLYRVQKAGRNDPNRQNPLRETLGKTQRIAAVGVSLSF